MIVRDCQNLVRELSKLLSRFVKIRIRDILFVNLVLSKYQLGIVKDDS